MLISDEAAIEGVWRGWGEGGMQMPRWRIAAPTEEPSLLKWVDEWKRLREAGILLLQCRHRSSSMVRLTAASMTSLPDDRRGLKQICDQ